MAARSEATRRRIAGSCVSVALDARLSFNEAAALKWSLLKLRRLCYFRVVDVPPEHAECALPAIDRVLERLDAAEEWAEAALRDVAAGKAQVAEVRVPAASSN